MQSHQKNNPQIDQIDSMSHTIVVFSMGKVLFAFPLENCLEVLLPDSLFYIKDRLLFDSNEGVKFSSVFGEDIQSFFLYKGEIIPLISLCKKLSIYESDKIAYILPFNMHYYYVGIGLTSMVDIVVYTKEDILYDDKVNHTDYLKYQVAIDNTPPIYVIDFLKMDYFKADKTD